MFTPRALAATAAAAIMLAGAGGSAAHAGTVDHDGDGIPTRWEKDHRMRPYYAADARADFDKDGLKNLAEYRKGTRLRDEDTDNDGHDDGDEVRDGYRSTNVKDADTDNDGVLDGEEDADRDGVDNEDEDDARELCRADDDDRDRDNVEDEDENELGSILRDADSDDDGILDGDEDADQDGEANEDEDDAAEDRCAGDADSDGESDEDDGDLFGVISTYDAETGALVVSSLAGYSITVQVSSETEIEVAFQGIDGDREESEGTAADLAVGTQVAELDLDDDTGVLEEIEILQ